jgi:anti-sigma factor RsiW
MTKQLEENSGNSHADLVNLIPWYVKGTLPHKDQMLIEHHLADCALCQQEVISCKALSDSLPATSESWKPSFAHFAGIMAEVDKLEAAAIKPEQPFSAAKAKSKFSFLQHLSAWLAQTPNPVRWTLAFETLAVAVLALLVVLPLQPKSGSDGVFETLSNAESPALKSGASIRLVLADDLTAKELSELMKQAKAQIQQGPSAVGSYTVAVSGEEAIQALSVFRSHPKVRLAQPIEPNLSDQ